MSIFNGLGMVKAGRIPSGDRAGALRVEPPAESQAKPLIPCADLATIGLRCGDVADAVFPHYTDGAQRSRLALALVELVRVIRDRDATLAETHLAPSEGSQPGPLAASPNYFFWLGNNHVQA